MIKKTKNARVSPKNMVVTLLRDDLLEHRGGRNICRSLLRKQVVYFEIYMLDYELVTYGIDGSWDNHQRDECYSKCVCDLTHGLYYIDIYKIMK